VSRSVCFLFVDGVGLGEPGAHNPLDADWPHLYALAGGRWTRDVQRVEGAEHLVSALDANLGVEGLPQSGTGQTALFAGFNAPHIAGRHWGPFPHSATRARLERESLFARLPGARRAFVNAYPDRFFAYAERSDRWSTTTRMCRAAGVRLRTHADLLAGRALTADLTGLAWRERLGLDVPLLTAREAGTRLHDLARAHDLTLLEYFLTDKAGHSRNVERARHVLTDLDALIAGYLDRFEPVRDLLVVTSDHGNLEDLRVKGHTRNPVPLLALGAGASALTPARDLTDVTPLLAGLIRPPA
jgi:hypothetical protein